MNNYRIALFMDFENLYTALKNADPKESGRQSAHPQVNFEHLVKSIESAYGMLEAGDFFVAANLSRYGQALSGADRYATLINLDDASAGRGMDEGQKSTPRHYSIRNFAAMRLAFEAGRHIERNPADFYLFVGTEASLTAAAGAIREQHHRQVEFLLPAPEKSSILKALFPCRSFADFQPQSGKTSKSKQKTAPKLPASEDPTARLLELLSNLRREFSTAIPVDLLNAMMGPTSAQRLVDRARTESKIDVWKNNAGTMCVSRYEERVVGKVVKMNTRPSIELAGKILYIAAGTSETLNVPISRAEWRKILKQKGDFSNAEAKFWLEELFEHDILRDGVCGRLKLALEDVIAFVKLVEERSLDQYG